jgi:hypothetical protein
MGPEIPSGLDGRARGEGPGLLETDPGVAEDLFAEEGADLFEDGGALGTGSNSVGLEAGYTLEDQNARETSDDKSRELSLTGAYGRYLASGLELALELQWIDGKESGDGYHATVRRYGIGLAPRYHFDVGSEVIVPYVGVRGMYGVVKHISKQPPSAENPLLPRKTTTHGRGFAVGALLGVKFFLSTTVSFHVQYEVIHSEDNFRSHGNLNILRDRVERTTSEISTGFTFYF